MHRNGPLPQVDRNFYDEAQSWGLGSELKEAYTWRRQHKMCPLWPAFVGIGTVIAGGITFVILIIILWFIRVDLKAFEENYQVLWQ